MALLAGCGSSTSPYGGGGGGGGGGCTPTATTVCMVGTTFSSASLTIAAGQTVMWMNGSGITHTVTSSASSAEVFNSGSVLAGGSFSHKFATAGTYHYYCQIHGLDGNPPTGMAGTITVQ
ncbi:MAG TPA: plastocyanin/azurin family copper-binding protein [Gemmatimonadales bacterium]|nr:plastocyanin/azurin family copper-binding protein [Gemmatimonadales bacterium]